jgi:hypothetical protein
MPHPQGGIFSVWESLLNRVSEATTLNGKLAFFLIVRDINAANRERAYFTFIFRGNLSLLIKKGHICPLRLSICIFTFFRKSVEIKITNEIS